ncbi:IS4 family transposase [Mucilaginibacter ginsenosidivorax]|uniref:IS4 family transposase n=1 Tax=Mucilaginibacter ginsenosidivorax TaxID=862126 RepID=A0A5B8W705_9SPHI|nr:IS4 family transposase [Mucilaginibacter ginsenosidivorax]QEC79399.1 IS4 family transposase [Mucilaginibacter ginsenosidivorax]
MPKDNFFSGQPVFAQLLSLIPRHIVSKQSQKYSADRYCKSFMSYDHLVTMLYQGFFQCLSLRELVTGLQANRSRLLHLGLTNTPRRSTLSDANSRRPADFFAAAYHQLYRYFYGSLPDSRPSLKKLFIIDSTTISLFSNIMGGAGMSKSNGKRKGGIKAHVMIDAEHNLPCFTLLTEARHHDLVFLQEVQVPPGSIVVFDRAYTNYKQFEAWGAQGIAWVTRQKNDANYQLLSESPVSTYSSEQGVIADQSLLLDGIATGAKYPLSGPAGSFLRTLPPRKSSRSLPTSPLLRPNRSLLCIKNGGR